MIAAYSRKEHDVTLPSPPLRSRVLPAVEPLRLAITPEGARVIGKSADMFYILGLYKYVGAQFII